MKHKFNVVDEGSGLRPTIMECNNCKLTVEIFDSHPTFYLEKFEITKCQHTTNGECLGWPKMPGCDKVKNMYSIYAVLK